MCQLISKGRGGEGRGGEGRGGEGREGKGALGVEVEVACAGAGGSIGCGVMNGGRGG